MCGNGIFSLKEVRELGESAKRGRLSHAYILLSEDAMLRKGLINTISKLILCKVGGCDCSICKKIDAGSYVDIAIFNEKSNMKVKDTEELIDGAYTKGFEGDTKLYFIDNANSLSPQVQNKLLKIYEEPPKNVTIFLLSSNENGILKTILSRAVKIYLPAYTTKQVMEELVNNGIKRETAQSAAVFSGGRLDKAFQYAENDIYREIYENVFTILIECKNSSFVSSYLLNMAFLKENIVWALEFFEIILRDVMEHLSNGTNYITVLRDYDIKSIASGFNLGSAAMAIDCVTEAKKMLTFNVNNTSVAEKLLFNILEVKYKWR